jgi:hypothetical protein
MRIPSWRKATLQGVVSTMFPAKETWQHEVYRATQHQILSESVRYMKCSIIRKIDHRISKNKAELLPDSWCPASGSTTCKMHRSFCREITRF